MSKLDEGRLLAEEFGVEAEPWSLEQVRDVLRTDHYFGAVHYPNAFQINPLAYCLALADAIERAGVFVFENTPALSLLVPVTSYKEFRETFLTADASQA